MTKLHQLLAVEKTVRGDAGKVLTQAYQTLQKSTLLSGISRTYRPRDDEHGDQLPAEIQRVQISARDVIPAVERALANALDVVAAKDETNTVARADVVIRDEQGREHVLLTDVPATYLLFLEKQLVDIHSFVSKLPTLDPTESWSWDANVNAYATDQMQTHRTKKVPQVQVLYEATDRHPAQVRPYETDEVVGYWHTVRFSGALPEETVRVLQDRVRELQRAVSYARAQANSVAVEDRTGTGEKLLGYIFGGSYS